MFASILSRMLCLALSPSLFVSLSLFPSPLPESSIVLFSSFGGLQSKSSTDSQRGLSCRAPGLWLIQARSGGSLIQLLVTRLCLILLLFQPGAGNEPLLLQCLAAGLFLASSHEGGGWEMNATLALGVSQWACLCFPFSRGMLLPHLPPLTASAFKTRKSTHPFSPDHSLCFCDSLDLQKCLSAI